MAAETLSGEEVGGFDMEVSVGYNDISKATRGGAEVWLGYINQLAELINIKMVRQGGCTATTAHPAYRILMIGSRESQVR